MQNTTALCAVAQNIIATPQAFKQPFSRIVQHAHTCSECNPKVVAASIANTVFSRRLLQKMQHA